MPSGVNWQEEIIDGKQILYKKAFWKAFLKQQFPSFIIVADESLMTKKDCILPESFT